MNLLFAIDSNLKEVIVSDSPKGSTKVVFIERLKQQEYIDLYKAVELLTSVSQSNNFDAAIFKAVDKVCQLLYIKHNQSK
jgi:low affinity Fe/Cu permease